MAAALWRAERLPALLGVCRSARVRRWDPPALDRALGWARYFQHLHGRARARPLLREALARRMRRAQPCPLLGFPALRRCPQLLGLALLENRALPPAACRRLLLRLLPPPGAGAGPESRGLPLLARRKAAARLLALPLALPLRRRQAGAEPGAEPEPRLLLGRLREERRQGAGLCPVLEQLPRPRAFAVVAAALALLQQGSGAEGAGDGDGDGDSDGDGDGDGSGLDGNRPSAAGDDCVAEILLSWLLGNLERFSAFCLCLPGSLLASLAGHYSQLSRSYLDLLTGWGSHLHYDPLQGRWVKSRLDKAELSWEELRERFRCLCQGPALLREQTQTALKLLKTRDGDFKVPGLSVWTDLLAEVEEYLRNEVGC